MELCIEHYFESDSISNAKSSLHRYFSNGAVPATFHKTISSTVCFYSPVTRKLFWVFLDHRYALGPLRNHQYCWQNEFLPQAAQPSRQKCCKVTFHIDTATWPW